MNNLNNLAQKWRAAGGHLEQAADELERAIGQAQQGVPDAAAEVLAEMRAQDDTNYEHYSQIKQWADRIERALSAQGEAVAACQACGKPVPQIGVAGDPLSSCACARLYTHPAPARVTEEMVERAAVGIHEFRRAYTCRGSLDEQDDGYQARVRGQARAALTAALEADRHD